MSVKYFCDICLKEMDVRSRIHLMGNSSEIDTLCKECWNKAEEILLSKKLDVSVIKAIQN